MKKINKNNITDQAELQKLKSGFLQILMGIIFTIHSFVLLYNQKETIRIPQILMANIWLYPFIYERKHSFSLVGAKKSMSDLDFIK